MHTKVISVFLAGILTTGICFAEQEIESKIVTELNRWEVYQTHLFIKDQLVVGQRAYGSTPHRLEFYDSKGEQKLSTMNLRHSASYAIKLTDSEFAIVGKSADPWRTYLTRIRSSNGLWRQSTHNFAVRYQMDRVTSAPQSFFLTEPGSRSLFELRSGRVSRIPIDISGPRSLTNVNGMIWVHEGRTGGRGDDTLVRYDMGSRSAERFFMDAPFKGVSTMLSLPDLDQVVIAEPGTQSIHILDSFSGKIVTSAKTKGEPYGLLRINQCLLVMNDDTRILGFYDIEDIAAGPFAQWSLEGADDRLKLPRKMAVNLAEGVVFARSAFPCPSCTATQSSVWAFREPSMQTFSRCQ